MPPWLLSSPFNPCPLFVHIKRPVSVDSSSCSRHHAAAVCFLWRGRNRTLRAACDSDGAASDSDGAAILSEVREAEAVARRLHGMISEVATVHQGDTGAGGQEQPQRPPSEGQDVGNGSGDLGTSSGSVGGGQEISSSSSDNEASSGSEETVRRKRRRQQRRVQNGTGAKKLRTPAADVAPEDDTGRGRDSGEALRMRRIMPAGWMAVFPGFRRARRSNQE